MKELVIQARQLFGVSVTPAQVKALELYEKELLAWNAHVNLTAIRDAGQVRIKHFLDSFSCWPVMREAGANRVIDVGTGAGFPGLPLKIIFPAMQLTLVESVGKKAEFCRHIIKILGLEGVEVVQERAEVVGRSGAHRQQYDWAIARAVAILPILLEYLLPLVRIGGSVLAMKGENAPAEMQLAEHATQLLGGELKKILPVALPGVAEQRYLVVIEKMAATPEEYPRRVGIPEKRPLLAKPLQDATGVYAPDLGALNKIRRE